MRIEDYNGVVSQNAIKIIRDTGIKQCVIAKKAGYTKQQFNNMLKGRKVIKAIDVLNIANALGVEPNELYGITKEEECETV